MLRMSEHGKVVRDVKNSNEGRSCFLFNLGRSCTAVPNSREEEGCLSHNVIINTNWWILVPHLILVALKIYMPSSTLLVNFSDRHGWLKLCAVSHKFSCSKPKLITIGVKKRKGLVKPCGRLVHFCFVIVLLQFQSTSLPFWISFPLLPDKKKEN